MMCKLAPQMTSNRSVGDQGKGQGGNRANCNASANLRERHGNQERTKVLAFFFVNTHNTQS